MDIFTLKLAFRKAKKYIDSFVIPQGAISVPVPRDQLAQDVRASLSRADGEPGERHREIGEAIQTLAVAMQGKAEELNEEILETNHVLAGARTANSPTLLKPAIGETTDIPLLAVAYKDDVWMPGKTLVFDAMGTVGVYIGGPGGPSANVDPLPVLTKSVPTAGDGALARRDDGFLLKFSRTGIINIPPGTSEDLLDGVAIENVAVHANADLSMWGMNGKALVFPAFDGYVAYLLEVRLDGDTGGAGGQPREFTVSLVRQAAGTTVAKAGIVKLDNTDLKANFVNFSTWTKGVDDPYIDGGVRVVLNNTSGQQITLSQVDLVVKGTRH